LCCEVDTPDGVASEIRKARLLGRMAARCGRFRWGYSLDEGPFSRGINCRRVSYLMRFLSGRTSLSNTLASQKRANDVMFDLVYAQRPMIVC
jgi:hypothetical protein